MRVIGAKAALHRLTADTLRYPNAVKKACVKAGMVIERSAKPKAPVDTGNLRSSIKTTPIIMGAEVGPHADYGAYVEFGTVNMDAQPYLRPALDENKERIDEIVRKDLEGT